MSFYTFRPVANGLGTDHPIPDLPFVDDSHLPTDPRAIEAVGRKEGGSTWGRQDNVPRSEGWAAFTTDAERTDLAWYVRFHPGHGRSVMLVRDDDASLQHQTFVWDMPTALAFRAGGYWWDGAFWYRPAQIFDSAAERIVARAVPGATTVTAADLLDSAADASRARILTVAEFDLDAPAPRQWLNDLALWAQRRNGGKPLDECVVRLAAPELSGDQLISAAEMAQIADIEPSTFRAYTARGKQACPNRRPPSAGATPGPGRWRWTGSSSASAPGSRSRTPSRSTTRGCPWRRGSPSSGPATPTSCSAGSGAEATSANAGRCAGGPRSASGR
ncbi:hypothetical protein ACFQ9X_57145 [Catenulispora yoronensis]